MLWGCLVGQSTLNASAFLCQPGQAGVNGRKIREVMVVRAGADWSALFGLWFMPYNPNCADSQIEHMGLPQVMMTDRFENNSAAGPRNVVVLGSTGSIGQSTLSVVAHDGGTRLNAYGLVANSSVDRLVEQAKEHRPKYVGVASAAAAGPLRQALQGTGIEVLEGPEAIERLVADPEVDRVVSAVVGSAGLGATWAALEAGKTVALANKETLVVAGPLVMALARSRGAHVLPVDSEHSAIFQAMCSGSAKEVKRVILTSSGGPFRGKSRSDLQNVQPAQALKHPTWNMGPKISIDSATLMNKALEMIEARWLFDLKPEQIEVVIHPESIVHSFVEFVDGSVIAQLSPPDMRLPIQYALTYPDRFDCPAPRLDLSKALALNCSPPDRETFPALEIAEEVMRMGGTAGSALNAANEVAVERFLGGSLAFLDIPRVCRAVLDHHTFESAPTLDTLWRVDAWARQEVARWGS